MKYIFYFIVILLGLSLVGMGIRILFFPVNTATKMIDMAYDAQDKVLDADNAIYNYEWFKQKYQDIEATKKQFKNAETSYSSFKNSLGERSTWTFEDKTEDARLRTVSLGLQNHLESQIADYNARASMATRNIFEDSVLPNYIDALTFIKQ
ncbi:TPA: hypothetical protein DEP58_01535 [Patescibacteria group bacterium]|nr:hypothetical protein [Patescibacteria group bacterium]